MTVGHEGPEGRSSGGPTVLLVDDEPTILVYAKAVLEGSGYRVLTAHDRAAAEQVASRVSPGPDLLIADLRLPDGSGDELARELREHRPDLPVLLVSGDGLGTDAAQQGLPMLAKPFTPNQLLEAVRRAVAGATDDDA